MRSRQPFFSPSIGAKISLLAVCPVLTALATVFATILVQDRRLAKTVDPTIRQQAFSEAAKIAKNVWLLCTKTEARSQKDITYTLVVAHDLLAQGRRPSAVHGTDDLADDQPAHPTVRSARVTESHYRRGLAQSESRRHRAYSARR